MHEQQSSHRETKPTLVLYPLRTCLEPRYHYPYHPNQERKMGFQDVQAAPRSSSSTRIETFADGRQRQWDVTPRPHAPTPPRPHAAALTPTFPIRKLSKTEWCG
ncbi:hypothetical protein IAQ61_002435 [Plenodomus lingam]|uniref:uncharacterized protein n=1 Tax=Leptosphaeria maculans TaxID=5022 RepID=UPI003320D2A4|nr:hypothetical protein IAQ61_002435 [Plenodomus lingam]